MAEWINEVADNTERIRLARKMWEYADALGTEYRNLCLEKYGDVISDVT